MALTSEPVARRVWTGPTVDPTIRPTFDGRRVAYVHPSGDIAIHDLVTGTDSRLTSLGNESASGAFFDTPAASPDGEWVAYTFWSGSADRYELRLLHQRDGSVRVIAPSGSTRSLQPIVWSRDSKRLAVALPQLAGISELGVVDLAGNLVVVPGSSRLTSPDGGVQFAGDERTLLVDVRQPGGSDRRFDVVAVDVGSGRTWPVVSGPADDRLAGLSADGAAVLFFSDRAGTRALYAQPVSARVSSVGEPIVVRPDMWSATGLGITSTGSALYTVQTRQQTMYALELDPSTASVGALQRVAVTTGIMRAPYADWMGDGTSTVQNFRPAASRGGQALTVRSAISGDAREIPTTLAEINAIHAAPDGNRVLVSGRDAANRIGVYVVDVATGGTRAIATASYDSAAMVRGAGWSQDSKTAFYTVEEFRRDRLRLVGHDVTGAGERTVLDFPCTVNCGARVSHDGSMMVTVQPAPGSGAMRLLVMPTTGGNARELARAAPSDRFVGNPAWTPDGRAIIIALANAGNGRVDRGRFLIAHVDGRPPSIVTLDVEGPVTGVRVHPDGRKVLFFGGEAAFELWSLDSLQFRLSH